MEESNAVQIPVERPEEKRIGRDGDRRFREGGAHPIGKPNLESNLPMFRHGLEALVIIHKQEPRVAIRPHTPAQVRGIGWIYRVPRRQECRHPRQIHAEILKE